MFCDTLKRSVTEGWWVPCEEASSFVMLTHAKRFLCLAFSFRCWSKNWIRWTNVTQLTWLPCCCRVVLGRGGLFKVTRQIGTYMSPKGDAHSLGFGSPCQPALCLRPETCNLVILQIYYFAVQREGNYECVSVNDLDLQLRNMKHIDRVCTGDTDRECDCPVASFPETRHWWHSSFNWRRGGGTNTNLFK